MITDWVIEHKEMLDRRESSSVATDLSLEEAEPSTASPAISPYSLDFGLMGIVFAILIFLWVQ